MNDISVGWRQVRIFTSDFSEQWYFGLLAAFAAPFAERYPETPFWFTRYTAVRGAPNEDKDDTRIEEIQVPYLSTTNEHRSIRFRFQPSSDEEAFLESLFTAAFWRSDFRGYDVLSEFGGSRFCVSTDINQRMRRTAILAGLFHHNSLLVLHAINQGDGPHQLEINKHNENTDYHSTFVSVHHIVANPMGQTNGARLPLVLPHPSGQGVYLI
jgi:hypothetical protein